MSLRNALVIGWLILAAIVSIDTASAAGNRTWVASNGDDSSADCTRAAPCRRFDAAYPKTLAGGEITCVDSAGYSGVVIEKSITINCLNADGTSGSSVGVTAVGITVNVSSSDKVTLRGLDLDLAGRNASSILSFTGAGTLILDKVKISNVSLSGGGGSGLSFTPDGTAKLIVTDSIITSTGNGTGAGIRIAPTPGGAAQVLIKNSNISSNVFGIAIDGNNSTGGINATIVDSVMAGNAQDGIVATSSPSTAPIGVAVINSQSINNAYGIRSIGSNVTVRVEGSKIIGNGTGISGGGALLTGGGNTVEANATNGGFTGAYSLK